MNETIKKQFVAVRAVIKKDEKFLIIREAGDYAGGTNHGKYDFPGGKIKPGENIREAILRETREEVGLDVKIGKPFFVTEWGHVIKGEQIQIIGIFYLCEPLKSEIVLGADFDDYKWVSLDEYSKLPLINATKEAFKALLS